MDSFIATNNIQLHYLDHPGAGPTLVLAPGITANAHAFDAVVQQLDGRVRVLALDLRGRGLSSAPPTGYTMADHAADVLGLLDALGLEQVVIGGHSFGGFLSFYLAANTPERIERLVVLDAAIGVAVPRTRELIQPSLNRLGQTYASFDDYLALIKAAPYVQGWAWDPAIESYYRADVLTAADGSVRARAQPEHIGAAMDGVIAEPWHDHLARITQPVLLVNAPGSYGPPGAPPIVSAEQTAETVALLPDCRSIEVPGNHQTMLYGAGATAIAEAICAFVGV
jgi:pimeloyl-ACP methyl ester carboxylesterase